jgi:hypothetical protein
MTTITTNKPSHTLYATREYRKGSEVKTIWTRIGAAWGHKDGKGFNVQLDMLPLPGSYNGIVLREPLPEDAATEA